MSLESALADITVRHRQGRFPNEQSISQGVVLRVLQELGWDTFDPAISSHAPFSSAARQFLQFYRHLDWVEDILNGKGHPAP